jgi:hypothetical protein
MIIKSFTSPTSFLRFSQEKKKLPSASSCDREASFAKQHKKYLFGGTDQKH